jgi:hypothetical protein
LVSTGAISMLLIDAERILHLAPAERLHELRNSDRFFASARRV